MTVPFFSQRDAFGRQRARIEELLDRAIDAGQFVNGPVTRDFEVQLARWTGARHALGVASGTDALVLALEACGIGPGDDVVVPVYTFFASASAVVHAGARPVFADIDPDSYAIAPESAASAISRAENPSAIMPVHLFRHMADMAAIGDLAARNGLRVVEDSAEGIGMRQGGRHAGLLGEIGVLSFFPSKTLGALGDAGAVLTDDDELAHSVAMRRSHGARLDGRPYVWELRGWNSRMDDIQAAVLTARLEGLAEEMDRRRQLAALYDEGLAPLGDRVTLPRPNPASVDAAVYVYLVELDRRDELVAHLDARGIGTEVYYPRPLHLQPCFEALGYRRGEFPVAEHAAERALALPLYPDLSDGQVEQVCAAIREFYALTPSRSGALSR